MSAPPVAPKGRSDPAPSRPRNRRRTWLIVLGVVVAVLIVVLVAALALGGAPSSKPKPQTPSNSVAGDPDNLGPTGSRAVTKVISDHGVDVTVARGLDELRDRTTPGADDTVVLSGSGALTPANASYLLDKFRGVRRVILLQPSGSAIKALGLPVTVALIAQTRSTAACSLLGIAPDDVISSQGIGLGSHSSAARYTPTQPAASCFPDDTGTGSDVVDRPGQMVVVPATSSHPEIVVTDGDFWQNATLAEDDNAGVALRVLAPSGRLIWFIPSFGDRPPEPGEPDTDPRSQIPRWIGPGFLLAAFAVFALMLWRGRRFGPMVTEPLPAVVKAIETTQARGRLYHRAGADTRAAAILRIRTISRIAGYLGLHYDPVQALDALDASDEHDDSGVWTPDGSDSSVAAIISVAAAATHRDARDVARLLTGPLPEGDDALVVFTTELTALEKEVRGTP